MNERRLTYCEVSRSKRDRENIRMRKAQPSFAEIKRLRKGSLDRSLDAFFKTELDK